MLVARLGFEFLRPVPLSPLRVETEVVRAGRRVQLLEGRLHAGGEEVCRATALRIRRTAEPIVAPTPAEAVAHGPGDGHDVGFPVAGLERSFIGAMEKRFVAGGYGRGPATVWMRLSVPLLADEASSALQRAAAAADFGNGVSTELGWDEHLFINPDLTLHLERPPEGEWICLDARTRIDARGTGSAESVLLDRRGRFGRAVQALFVDRR